MIVLGVDYSTKRCGFTVMDSFYTILFCQTATFENKTHKEIRLKISEIVTNLINEYNVDFILLEKVRLFSRGSISFDAVYQLAGIVASIVNVSSVPVYSVDVRAWKYRILGSAKASKEDAVNYVKQKYNIDHNHDVADSICIAECGIKYAGDKILKVVN